MRVAPQEALLPRRHRAGLAAVAGPVGQFDLRPAAQHALGGVPIGQRTGQLGGFLAVALGGPLLAAVLFVVTVKTVLNIFLLRIAGFDRETALVGGLSMVGVPLTVGFVSKWYLVLAAVDGGHWLMAGLILGSSLLALIYVWKVVEVAYFQPPAEGASEVKEAPFGLLAPALRAAAGESLARAFRTAASHR